MSQVEWKDGMLGYYLGIEVRVIGPTPNRPGWIDCEWQEKKGPKVYHHWHDQVMTEPWGDTRASTGDCPADRCKRTSGLL